MLEIIDCTEPKPFAAESTEPDPGSVPPRCSATKCGGPHRTKTQVTPLKTPPRGPVLTSTNRIPRISQISINHKI